MPAGIRAARLGSRRCRWVLRWKSMLYLLFALIDRWRVPRPLPGRCDWLTRTIYAHRGMHGANAVENSPTAFARAIAAGLGIECDVQRSRDGQAVVFHDETLERLTAREGEIREETAATLGTIALTGSTDTIPTLPQLLAQVAGQVPLLIEIKIAHAGRVAPLCLAVRRALEGYAGPVAIMSFDPAVPSWFARYAPHVVRGLVMTEEGWRTLLAGTRRHWALWRARPDFIAYDIDDLAGRFAQGQRRRGLPVLSWTIDDADRAARVRKLADAPIAESAGLASLMEPAAR
jgi:glycerophosphoryl diester phosphodiesterase